MDGICANGMYGMMSWMAVWGLIGLAVLVLAVAGAVWVVVRSNGKGSDHSSTEAAKGILRRRFAAGELDEDEYRRRMAGLSE